MADTTFFSKITRIAATWLNDVNALRYGAGDATKGSALLQFLQSGSGATATDLQTRGRLIVYVEDFGAKGDGITNDSTAINNAIATGKDVAFVGGRTYKASGLTQSTNGQSLVCFSGIAIIQKNANGVLFTSSGNNVSARNIWFRGDAASPTFTGNNINASGSDFVLINCGSRWTSGRAVKATGQHTQIYGSSDIYQTTDATATGYDIEIGVSGTATLYHELYGIYSSQSTGGILLIDVGSHHIVGGQFGKLKVAAGTSPGGVNGGHTLGARILGNTDFNLSNSVCTGCIIGAVTVTFAAGTSGHSFDCNTIDASATITDNSNNSNVVDTRQIPLTTYTSTWTAASVNPAIGNGTISAAYSKRGRWVNVAFNVVMGSTTTFGTGTWYFSLPFVPAARKFYGSAVFLSSGVAFFVGVVESLDDLTARCDLYGNNTGNTVNPTIPFTWKSGDEIRVSLLYST